MRFFLIVISMISLQSTFANEPRRLFVCKGIDSIERVSDFEINVDSGLIRLKDISSSNWQDVYNKHLKCSLKISSSVNCDRKLIHNLDDPNRSYEALVDRVKCIRSNGKPEIQLNSNLEINRSGDGTGSFVCGLLPKFNLRLEDCQVKVY